MMYDNDTEREILVTRARLQKCCVYTPIFAAINALLKLHLFSPSFEGKSKQVMIYCPWCGISISSARSREFAISRRGS